MYVSADNLYENEFKFYVGIVLEYLGARKGFTYVVYVTCLTVRQEADGWGIINQSCHK